MKLNPEAVRDVLLNLESQLNYEPKSMASIDTIKIKPIFLKELVANIPETKKYTKDELTYATQKLFEAGYISGKPQEGGNHSWIDLRIYDITWSGHEFLNSVRGKKIWEKVKEGCEKVGDMSVGGLTFTAKVLFQAIIANPQVIQEFINTLIQ